MLTELYIKYTKLQNKVDEKGWTDLMETLHNVTVEECIQGISKMKWNKSQKLDGLTSIDIRDKLVHMQNVPVYQLWFLGLIWDTFQM